MGYSRLLLLCHQFPSLPLCKVCVLWDIKKKGGASSAYSTVAATCAQEPLRESLLYVVQALSHRLGGHGGRPYMYKH